MFRSKSSLARDNSAFVTGSESAAKLFVENKRTEDTAKAGRQAGRQADDVSKTCKLQRFDFDFPFANSDTTWNICKPAFHNTL